MKTRLFTLAALILIGIFAGCPTPTGEGRASYTVGGTVTIAGDDSGAAGALLQLKQSGVTIGDPVQADGDGGYTISGVFAGNYTIDVSLEGYDPGGDGETGDDGGNTGDSETGGAEPPDAVSGASESVSHGSGSSGGGSSSSDRVIAETPIPAAAKTFSGGFGGALDNVKKEPSGGTYRVELTNGTTRPPYDMAGFNTPVTIVIDGKGKSVSLEGGYNGKGSLLTIPAGVTVFLKDITFRGCDTNTKAIITVAKGGKLVMKEGAEITGAVRSPVDGGAVRVNAGGSFVMDGGYIRGNTGISNGGAVFISGGEFIMTGGEISGNQASNVGGVFMYNGGEFIMTGGKISGNTSKNYAGGVLVNGGNFEMRGGAIENNTCHLYGGGVFIGIYSNLSGSSSGLFVQKGGKISGNRAAGGGGGVGLRGSSAVFVLKGGEVSGNLAVPDDRIDPYGGGGVFVQAGGLFLCEGGSVKDNITEYELWGGGGVLIQAEDSAGGSGSVDAISGASSSGGSVSGGGTTYTPGLAISGGIITGNRAGNGMGQSIYTGTGDFTLSGSPSIDGSLCIEYLPTAAQHILIDGGFTGTALTLDLRGNENGITFIGNWMKPLLGMSGGGSISAAIRSRFTLRKFTSYSGKQTEGLSAYTIGADGKLVK
jgi:hypothetical protein